MYIRVVTGLFCAFSLSASAAGAEPASAGYSLRYQFQPGQVAEFETQHASTFNVSAQGQLFKSTSQLRTVKRWKVREVGSDQAARIEVTNLEVQMTANDGRQQIDLDSRDPEKQPEQFKELLSVVGKPLGVVSISPTGTATAVERLVNAPDLTNGLANLCVPLPEQPVAVGDGWNRDYSLTVTRSDGSSKVFQVRQKYQLEKVDGAIATVRYSSVLLTPLDDPQLEAQLAQQLPAGTFDFDLGRGLVVLHRWHIKKEVVGYAGPGTAMDFEISFVERLRPTAPTANAKP